MKYVYYFLILASGLFCASVFIVEGSSKAEERSMNDYVNPQVNISLNISNADGLKVEKLVSEYVNTLGFGLTSSVSAGEYGKKWAEKGMVKSLWKNQKNYIDLSNLLNTECFNVRIYTSSESESRDIEAKLVAKISKVYPDYVKYNSLQCR
ncbi:hypothetical protein LCGC14_2180840 [marine sediment metagenome]|uniref:Uncharacterized protein n=1 Tax=marine sediment metagenome TaxID=412755 RepID=A0A0F9DMC5_9ZZZZ